VHAHYIRREGSSRETILALIIAPGTQASPRILTMKFTLENNANVNVIRSYSSEELRIGEHSIR